MKKNPNKKLFSTAARRMAALLLVLCLSATTAWALSIVCITEASGFKGGKASRPDRKNFPQRVYVVPKPGFTVKSVVWSDNKGHQRKLSKLKVKSTTTGDYYDVPEITDCKVTVTFCFLSSNVEVNFDMNVSDASGPDKQNLQIGDLVTKPADPTDVNFNFLGWYTDEDFKKPFDFNTALDVTLPYKVSDEGIVLNLYAKWVSKWSWEYMTDDVNALHIIGPGPMDDYKSGKAPWYKDWNTINKINIDQGVTHIGNYAFKKLKYVASHFTIPASVKTIGNSAFYDLSLSTSFVNITTPTGSQLDSIDQNAFKNAKANIDLSNSTLLTKIDNSVFSGVGGSVILPASVDTILPKAFHNFKGSNVFIPVPEGKALIVNGMDYSGGITDGKADIVSYLFKDNIRKKGASLAVKLKMVSLSDYDNVTVTFNANGHGTAPASVNTKIGQTISEPDALTANGYIFFDWYKDAACTEAFDFRAELSRAGMTFSASGGRFILKLFAKWQKSSCTVTFNANGATEGTMADVTQNGGISYEIPGCGFTNTGHSFLGWSTSANGGVEYKPGDVINPLLNDLTLYAVWENKKSGSCGTGVTWTLTNSTANGNLDKLTISGNGAMTDYDKTTYIPWNNEAKSIKTLIIQNGVTHIGKNVFKNLEEITSDITIPASVKTIGQNAFNGISTSKNNPGIIATATGSQLTSIAETAFGCVNARIDLSNSSLLTDIGNKAFTKTTEDVTLSYNVTFINSKAFTSYKGDYVYLPVLENRVLTVNGEVYDEGKMNEDRQADIIGYIFNDATKRTKSQAVTLAQVQDPNVTFKVTTDANCDAYYMEEDDDVGDPSMAKKITEDTGVHPGATVWLSWGGENLAEGTYVSGFTVTKAGGGTVEARPSDDSEDYLFVMPEDNVTVTTHTAPRETFTLDLTAAEDTIVINEMVYILMQSLLGYIHPMEDPVSGRFLKYYDVNFDGKYDFVLTSPAGDDDEVDPDDLYAYDYTVSVCAGASEVTTNYLFTPDYPFPYKYNKILVKFKNSEEVQNQIKFDDLFDSSNYNFELVCDWSNSTRNLIIDHRTLFRDDDWNTICLPFDLTLAGSSFDFGEDEDSEEKPLEARQLTAASITDKTLNLTFSEPVTTLQAGVPYIIKWAIAPQNIEDPLFLNATIADVAACAGSNNEEKVAAFLTSKGYDNGATGDNRVRFIGTFGWTRFDKTDTSILFLGADNKLYYPEPYYNAETELMSTPEIGAFRAYFKLGEDGGASAREITDFNISFGDEETQGIISIENGKMKIENEAGAWYTVDGVRLDGKPTKKGLYIHGGKKVVIP